MAIPRLSANLPYKPFRAPRKIDPFKPLKRPPIDLGKTRATKALYGQIVPDLVKSMRAFQMKMAVEGVAYYRSKGQVFQPGDPVVTLVDGSPNKKLTNVRLGGSIVFVQGPGDAEVIEAAQQAYLILVGNSRHFRRSGEYERGFMASVDGVPMDASKLVSVKDFDRIEIFNPVPYSGKIERLYQPFWDAYKVLRASGWDKRVSMKLVIGGNPIYNPKNPTNKGNSIAMPMLIFQRLGAFKSRGPNRSDYYG